ncbi:hypothetical protein [Streptomyces sp. NRRL S-87]|uniref:hypothetical protein n=1 Tax=Streptomyces sp. NRRL S-87 TaxID=1463920 RepID=UPI00099BB631|nr:hypothetical protein [Streptomyces sp. NRRL S-87]
MARTSSGIVAGLTAAAIAAVGFLAYQAQASAPRMRAASPQQPGKTEPKPDASTGTGAGTGAGTDKRHSDALPADSGTGVRVVYSVGGKRVWLVGPGAKAPRTFEVVPSTVHPKPGTYAVTSRSGQVQGSDGVPIEHVVRFTSVGGVAIGFSARLDGKLPAPKAGQKTGGIRMTRPDGDAMWSFATVSSKVVVVP